MPIYSHSKLSTYEHCQLKFKFKYMDIIEPDFEDTIESFLGRQVHKTLEWIYNSNENFELDNVIKYFIESWNKDFNSKIKLIREYETIESYFNKGIKFLISYFVKNSPFKDNTIATEKKILVNLDPNGNYKVFGYIDRLVYHQDTNIFEIHDYKTGSIKSQEELDKDRQLALYSIAIRDYFNASDVHLIWHFLDDNKEVFSKRTLEDLENLKKEIINLIKKIESNTNFFPNPGYLCNWCEFQSKCPAFKENEKEIKNLINKIK